MRKSDRPAFTLFETVAAVTIVGLTAVSALAAVGAEMRTAERSRRAIEVEALATQRLDFMTLVSDAGLRTLPDSVANGKFDPPLEGYKWQTTSRSEEHTSELQSPDQLVCRLLLEKKQQPTARQQPGNLLLR